MLKARASTALWRSLVAASLLSGTAGAQGADVARSRSALAEGLFEEGKTLLDEGHVSAACAKFSESMRVEAALGTLLNLAVCHEREGKAASAWSEFADAKAMAERAQENERAQFALSELERLRPVVPRLIVRVAASDDQAEVKLDHDTLGHNAWGTAIPLDAGRHQLNVSAKGKKTWATSFTLQNGAAPKVIDVPALVQIGCEPGAETNGEDAASGQCVDVTSRSRNSGGVRAGRTVGFISVGLGAVGIGVGAVYGLRALSKQRTVDADCSDGWCRSDLGMSADRDAHQAARLANISFGVGLLASAVGIYLLLSGGDDATNNSAKRPTQPSRMRRSSAAKPGPHAVLAVSSGKTLTGINASISF